MEKQTLIKAFNTITRGHLEPTDEDLERARQEIIDKGLFCAPDPGVFKLQVKTWAHQYPLARSRTTEVPPSQEELALERQKAEELRTKQEHARQVKTAEKLMGLTSIYSGISWMNPEAIQTDTIQYLRDIFPGTKKNSCLLLGNTGAGKTYAAICCLVANFSADYCFYVRAYDLAMAIQKRDFSVLDKVNNRSGLLIDDLGVSMTGYKGDDFIAFFENMFTTRHQNQRTTLMTSNGSLDMFKQTFGDRFISRFIDDGTVYVTNGVDLRRQTA